MGKRNNLSIFAETNTKAMQAAALTDQHTQAAEPISFEVQLDRASDAPAPPVKQRLELAAQHREREQLTLQMIRDKLDRASERKAQTIQSQVEHQHEKQERKNQIQERKSSQERAQGQQRVRLIDRKMALASANYQAQILSIQERARMYNERVLQIRERRSSTERAQEEKAQSEREQ